MLGRISKMARHGYSWCNCGHCSPDIQGQRSREKQEIRHHLLVEMNEVMDDAVR